VDLELTARAICDANCAKPLGSQISIVPQPPWAKITVTTVASRKGKKSVFFFTTTSVVAVCRRKKAGRWRQSSGTGRQRGGNQVIRHREPARTCSDNQSDQHLPGGKDTLKISRGWTWEKSSHPNHRNRSRGGQRD
jgi:hypothetical protein